MVEKIVVFKNENCENKNIDFFCFDPKVHISDKDFVIAIQVLRNIYPFRDFVQMPDTSPLFCNSPRDTKNSEASPSSYVSPKKHFFFRFLKGFLWLLFKVLPLSLSTKCVPWLTSEEDTCGQTICGKEKNIWAKRNTGN